MAAGTITVKHSEYRPCLVDCKKALFHRWAEASKHLVKFRPFVCQEEIEKFKETISNGTIQFFDNRVDVTPIMQTVAIVEYEDGTVAEVAPVQVRFLDSIGLFNSICFREADDGKT